jgi:hypothetical protein
MAYKVVFRVQPLKRQNLSGAQAHQLRERISENVDSSRSGQNRQLVGNGKLHDGVNAVLAKYPLASKASTLLAAELVATANADYFDEISPDWKSGKYSSAFEAWVKRNEIWFRDKFGEGLVSLTLHLDEDAPHFHAVVVPVHNYSMKRHGKDVEVTKVNYRKVFGDDAVHLAQARAAGRSDTDTKLGRMQTDYASMMTGLNLERGERNRRATHQKPDHERGRERAERELAEVRESLSKAERATEEAREQWRRWSEKAKRLEQQLENYAAIARQIEDRKAAAKALGVDVTDIALGSRVPSGGQP